ncbi:MAG: hypothetical protein ACI837_000803 [Crocinitomicaceae bacterium]|jgi:hypothetical protein
MRSLLTLLCFVLTFSNFVNAQPPFQVSAPDTYTNPVVIIIPDTNVNLESLSRNGVAIPVTFYYVENNIGTAINIVDSAGGLTSLHKKVKGKMHVRGDATSHDPKKQFSVKLDKEPKDGPFLGMENKGKHWIFNDCGVVDVTLIRNAFTFNMQQSMGEYSPHWKWFEVFMCDNTATIDSMASILANDYRGVYLNFDEIRFEKDRVEPKFKKEHPTSDMAILQLNQADPSKYATLSWVNSPAGPMELYEPDLGTVPATDTIITAINTWYSNWAGNTNDIYENYVLDTTDTTGLVVLLQEMRKNTDYKSFAVYFLINELSKDPDGYHKSTFMVKDTAICKAGPLWDKNKSYGNYFNNPSDTFYYNLTSGWLYHDTLNTIDANQSPQWWQSLLLDPAFCDTVWTYWNAYSTSVLDTTKMNTFIDNQVAYLSVPYAAAGADSTALLRNNACWQNGNNILLSQYMTQVEEFKSYLSGRIAWMTINLPLLLSKSGFDPGN